MKKILVLNLQLIIISALFSLFTNNILAFHLANSPIYYHAGPEDIYPKDIAEKIYGRKIIDSEGPFYMGEDAWGEDIFGDKIYNSEEDSKSDLPDLSNLSDLNAEEELNSDSSDLSEETE